MNPQICPFCYGPTIVGRQILDLPDISPLVWSEERSCERCGILIVWKRDRVGKIRGLRSFLPELKVACSLN